MMERYLTTAEVAEHYRTVVGTVRYWRHLGYGPRGVKMRGKVLYPESEVQRHDAQLRREVEETETATR